MPEERIQLLHKRPPLDKVTGCYSEFLLLIVRLAAKEIAAGGFFLRVKWRYRVHFHFLPSDDNVTGSTLLNDRGRERIRHVGIVSLESLEMARIALGSKT